MDNTDVVVVRALLETFSGKILYTKRAANDDHGGFLCLPGGKLEPRETSYEAILRELIEEIHGRPDNYRLAYCFSQEPVMHKGKRYRSDYFFGELVGDDIDGVVPKRPLVRLGEDVESLHSLHANDGLARTDIAYNNGVAHHFYDHVRRTGMHHPSWLRANNTFLVSGTIPTPEVYAPSLHPVRERAQLKEWMRRHDPFRGVQLPRNSVADHRMLRWGDIDEAEYASIRRQKEQRALRFMNDYCSPSAIRVA